MLEIRNLTKTYPDGKRAVSDVTLTVCDGDLYGMIGKNGAGKTTLIKACLGIHDYDSGEILLNGMSVKKHPVPCKKKMAYVPDSPVLEAYLTGTQYLNFICNVYEVPSVLRKKRTADLASRFGMEEKLDNLIASYSHGMKQKLCLIGAFMHNPELLVLDEPFVGLDPEAFVELKKLMKELCLSGGSVLFSSHILDVVEKTCSKIAIMKDGHLIRSGKTEDLLGSQDLEEVFMELNEK